MKRQHNKSFVYFFFSSVFMHCCETRARPIRVGRTKRGMGQIRVTKGQELMRNTIAKMARLKARFPTIVKVAKGPLALIVPSRFNRILPVPIVNIRIADVHVSSLSRRNALPLTRASGERAKTYKQIPKRARYASRLWFLRLQNRTSIRCLEPEGRHR